MNSIYNKIVVVPDVHARDFWREPVAKALEEGDKVIFLGDYVDPYPMEWDEDTDYRAKAVITLEEIIDLKMSHMDDVTLLIGNHDCGYAIGPDICSSRRDKIHATYISRLFTDNRNLFKLIDEEYRGGKHFIFSHAGLSEQYAVRCFGDEITPDNAVELFNKAWEENNYGIMDSLGIYDRYRGWGGSKYASLVWADVREWIDTYYPAIPYGEYQVFGHTRLNDDMVGTPIVTDRFAMIDCRAVFYIDNDGVLRRWADDQEMGISKFA